MITHGLPRENHGALCKIIGPSKYRSNAWICESLQGVLVYSQEKKEYRRYEAGHRCDIPDSCLKALRMCGGVDQTLSGVFKRVVR